MLRQRHERRGRPARLAQRAPVHPRPASTTSPTRSRASTTSAASAPTTTTPGAGRGRATRRSGCGSATRGSAACARRSSCTGRDGIDAAARCARSSATPIDLMPTVLDATGIGAPAIVDGVQQQPVDGASLVPTFADADGAEPAIDAVLRDARQPRASTTTAGRRRPTTSASQLTRRARAARGQPRLRRRTAGRCSTSSTTSPRRTTSPTDHPDVVRRARSSCGGPRPGATRCFRSTTASSAVRSRWSRRRAAPRVRDSTGPAVVRWPRTRSRRSARGFRLPRDVDVGAAGAEGIVSRSATGTTAGRCYLLDGRARGRVQPLRRRPTGAASEMPSRRASTPSASSTVRAAARRRAGHAAGRRRVVGESQLPADLPFRWQIGGAGLLIGRDRGFPCVTTTGRRSRSPGC